MTGVNHRAVEAIINEFVEYSSDDPDKLVRLLDVLEKEDHSRKTGLGYIIADARKKIAEKLQFITSARSY